MGRETLRLFVTGAFAFCALVLYQRWEAHTRPVQEDVAAPQAQAQDEGELSPDVPAPAAPSSSELPEVTQPLGASGAEVPEAAPEAAPASGAIAVTVSNDSLRAGFDGAGNLVRLDLLRHPVTLDGEPLALFFEGSERRFLPQTGLLGEGLPNHRDGGWALERPQPDSLKVSGTWTGDGVTVLRSYELPEDGYLISVSYVVTNNGDRDLAGHAYFQLLRDSDEPIDYSAQIPSFYGAAVYTDEEKYAKHDFDEFENYPRRSNDGWIAIVQRYFMAAWLDGGTARENYMRNLDSGDVSVGVIRALGSLGPGETVALHQPLYAGALEQKVLGAIDPELGRDVKLAVDYGFLTILAAPLFTFLAFINDYALNWGVSIILLTLVIKIVFFPLMAKSYRSMARMKNLAPKMQKLKERYGDDRQELQKATMEMYRKEKINPLGGCLPILIQIPVFIALYWMLLEAVELRQAPFGVWIRDLSSPDPLFVLPVVLGASMYGQFKLNPTPPDPTQAMIMKIMPIGFAAFSIIMPSGLVLYWITNTLLSIAQQWHITRAIAAEAKDKKPKATDKAKDSKPKIADNSKDKKPKG